MSSFLRGARALTMPGVIWQGIVETHPDLERFEYQEIWEKGKDRAWARLDFGMISTISLMKAIGWKFQAGETSLRSDLAPSSESSWRMVMNSINMDAMNRFARHIKTLPSDELIPTISQYLKPDPSLIQTSVIEPQSASNASWASW